MADLLLGRDNVPEARLWRKEFEKVFYLKVVVSMVMSQSTI